jgi:hypothetical protein
MVPTKNSSDLARRLPNSQRPSYPDAGHGAESSSSTRNSSKRHLNSFSGSARLRGTAFGLPCPVRRSEALVGQTHILLLYYANTTIAKHIPRKDGPRARKQARRGLRYVALVDRAGNNVTLATEQGQRRRTRARSSTSATIRPSRRRFERPTGQQRHIRERAGQQRRTRERAGQQRRTREGAGQQRRTRGPGRQQRRARDRATAKTSHSRAQFHECDDTALTTAIRATYRATTSHP